MNTRTCARAECGRTFTVGYNQGAKIFCSPVCQRLTESERATGIRASVRYECANPDCKNTFKPRGIKLYCCKECRKTDERINRLSQKRIATVSTKKRICLKCYEKFDSLSPANRICPECTLANHRIGRVINDTQIVHR